MTNSTDHPSSKLSTYDASQRKHITQFRAITGCNEDIAISTLDANEWDVDVAIDIYSRNRMLYRESKREHYAKHHDNTELHQIFDYYLQITHRQTEREIMQKQGHDHCLRDSDFESHDEKSMNNSLPYHRYCYTVGDNVSDNDNNMMLNDDMQSNVDYIYADGLREFFHDIGVRDVNNSVTPLIITWFLHCSELGEIHRNEFVKNFSVYSCGSMSDIRHEVQRRVKSIYQLYRELKEFYLWCFDRFKVENKSVVNWRDAVELWRLILPTHLSLLHEWLEYCITVCMCDSTIEQRGVNRDLWSQLLEFSRHIKPDLSNYDHNEGAWPSRIDDFVDWLKDRRKYPAEHYVSGMDQEMQYAIHHSINTAQQHYSLSEHTMTTRSKHRVKRHSNTRTPIDISTQAMPSPLKTSKTDTSPTGKTTTFKLE